LIEVGLFTNLHWRLKLFSIWLIIFFNNNMNLRDLFVEKWWWFNSTRPLFHLSIIVNLIVEFLNHRSVPSFSIIWWRQQYSLFRYSLSFNISLEMIRNIIIAFKRRILGTLSKINFLIIRLTLLYWLLHHYNVFIWDKIFIFICIRSKCLSQICLFKSLKLVLSTNKCFIMLCLRALSFLRFLLT
jgi:hypothetical protein